MPLVFLTGGASSGKSKFALNLLKDRKDVTFIATGVETDPEMENRIKRHRKGRPPEWETIEEPLDLLAAVKKVTPGRAVIIDCLTFWVSNLLYYSRTKSNEIIRIANETADFLKGLNTDVIVVTNEIGMGVIPATEDGRFYRTIIGEMNQIFASRADEAHMVINGIGLRLK